MLAGMLHKSGYFLGDNLYPPRDANPKGFYEDALINQLNEMIIINCVKSVGANPFAYRPGQLWLARFPIDMKFPANEYQQSIIRGLAARAPFCFKDPRFAFTLEAWLSIAPSTIVLCIFRDPASVIASIFKECSTEPYLFSFSISVETALAAWREIYWRLLTLYRKHTGIFFLSYRDILNGSVIPKMQEIVKTDLDMTMPEASLNRSKAVIPLDENTKLVFDTLLEISKDDLGQDKTSSRLSMIQHMEDKLSGTGLPCLPSHNSE